MKFQSIKQRICSFVGPLNNSIFGIFGLICGVITAIVFVGWIVHINIRQDDGDLWNWSSLLFEIGIGMGITTLVWILSQRNNTKIEELIIDIKKISENQHQIIQMENSRYTKRRNFIRRKIAQMLNICNAWFPSEEELKLFETDKNKVFFLMSSDTKEHILRIKCNPVRLIEIVIKLLRELEPVINSGFENLDADEFEKLENLIGFGNEVTDELDSQKLVVPLEYPDFREFFLQVYSTFKDVNMPTPTIKVMPNGFTKDF